MCVYIYLHQITSTPTQFMGKIELSSNLQIGRGSNEVYIYVGTSYPQNQFPTASTDFSPPSSNSLIIMDITRRKYFLNC